MPEHAADVRAVAAAVLVLVAVRARLPSSSRAGRGFVLVVASPPRRLRGRRRRRALGRRRRASFPFSATVVNVAACRRAVAVERRERDEPRRERALGRLDAARE